MPFRKRRPRTRTEGRQQQTETTSVRASSHQWPADLADVNLAKATSAQASPLQGPITCKGETIIIHGPSVWPKDIASCAWHQGTLLRVVRPLCQLQDSINDTAGCKTLYALLLISDGVQFAQIPRHQKTLVFINRTSETDVSFQWTLHANF